MDKEQFHKISDACREPIQLMPANNQVFAYSQSEPTLSENFTAPIRSLSTNIQPNAEFIELPQKQANSKPLLSLETGIALDVIHIANRTELTKEDELSKRVKKAYPEIFTRLGKHKFIKAKFIIDSTGLSPLYKSHGRYHITWRNKSKKRKRDALQWEYWKLSQMKFQLPGAQIQL